MCEILKVNKLIQRQVKLKKSFSCFGTKLLLTQQNINKFIQSILSTQSMQARLIYQRQNQFQHDRHQFDIKI